MKEDRESLGKALASAAEELLDGKPLEGSRLKALRAIGRTLAVFGLPPAMEKMADREAERNRIREARRRWEEEGREKVAVLTDSIVTMQKLSGPTMNRLEDAGIDTPGELRQKSVKDLLKINNFGYKKLEEIRGFLEELGLSLYPE